MTENVKIFSKLFIAHRAVPVEAFPLGYMTPYENTAASRLREANAVKWVSGEAQTKVFDNVPTSGFKFGDEIKRAYWGGGNVVWRVLDPRGFQLEIQSSNLSKILAYATIEAGEIKGECVWGRHGGKNILIPQGCPDFPNQIKNAEELTAGSKLLKERRIQVKDLNFGDFVTLHNSTKGIYLGKYWILTDGKREYYDEPIACNSLVERHLILQTEDYTTVAIKPARIQAIAELNVIEKKLSTFSELASTEEVKRVLVKYGEVSTPTGSLTVRAISNKKISFDNFAIGLSTVGDAEIVRLKKHFQKKIEDLEPPILNLANDNIPGIEAAVTSLTGFSMGHASRYAASLRDTERSENSCLVFELEDGSKIIYDSTVGRIYSNGGALFAVDSSGPALFRLFELNPMPGAGVSLTGGVRLTNGGILNFLPPRSGRAGPREVSFQYHSRQSSRAPLVKSMHDLTGKIVNIYKVTLSCVDSVKNSEAIECNPIINGKKFMFY